MAEKLNPVFYDPHNKRWKKFKNTLSILGIFFTIIFSVAILSIIINPILPVIGFSQLKGLPLKKHTDLNKTLSLSYKHYLFLKEKKNLLSLLNKQNINPKTEKKKHDTKVIGFFVNWDDTSLASLKHNINKLDLLIPEWLHLKNEQGEISVDDPVRQLEVIKYVNKYQKNLEIMPLINNFNNKSQNWESWLLKKMVNNKQSRANTINNLFIFVKNNHFMGINIDFESIPDEAQANLQLFMKELSEKFHSNSLKVTQSVPFDDSAFDYRELEKYNDYLILMAYDEHWSVGTSGPVASQDWFVKNLENRFKEISPEKTIVALGNYGYDWTANGKTADSVSFQEALTTAKESNVQIRFDPLSFNPNFDYYDETNQLHHLWFLDAVTAFNQAEETSYYQPYGLAIWKLGSEDPSIWEILDTENKKVINKISN